MWQKQKQRSDPNCRSVKKICNIMELIMPMCGALLLQIICLLLQKTNMPLCLCRLQRADNNLIGRVMRLVSLLPN